MTKRMLIDASHPEETRVVVLDGTRLEAFDIESANRKPLKGNIYLARVVRVEPSLQAAFVEYGGNRHGFLAFGEIHPDYYQLPVADRQRLIEMQQAEAREEREREEAEEAARAGDPSLQRALEVAAAAADAADAAAERRADVAEAAEGLVIEHEAAPTAESAERDEVAAVAAEAAAVQAEEVADDDAAEESRAEDSAVEEIASASTGVESIGNAEAPPPEMVGGSTEDDARDRRIPPRFMRHYKIQEVIKRRQVMLIQVVKEERGSKGAALTTYISLAGRFSVLMPNSPRGGGVSRKITSAADRKRLREIIDEQQLPDGMSLIVRTAGAQRPKPEIRKDCEYLIRLWDGIRERTFASTAPALIYEEADLIKRSIRDVFGKDVEEVLVDGEDAYQEARDFMRMLMPSHASKVRTSRDGVPLFARYNVDQALDAMHSPNVQLKSGGYIVINQTEALVAIDVNSGRATRDRDITDTALRTNCEAAEEIARQLRLRDLAGLIVIDFIDMDSTKHDAVVERRLKEALKQDRARIQVGRISHFGLLEMSRQRLRPSVVEHAYVTCAHCDGRGIVRSVESSGLQALRSIEEEGAKRRAAEVIVHLPSAVAFWLLNRKRERLGQIETRFGMAVLLAADDTLIAPALRIERTRAANPDAIAERPAALRMDYAPEPEETEIEAEEIETAPEAEAPPPRREPRGEPKGETRGEPRGEPRGETKGPPGETAEEGQRRRRRRRRRGRRDGVEGGPEGGPEGAPEGTTEGGAEEGEEIEEAEAIEGEVVAEAVPAEAPADDTAEGGETEDENARRRRRGRRGGRRRREEGEAEAPAEGEVVMVEAPPPPVAAAPVPRRQPTPADPFAGQMDDLMQAMEAAEVAAEAAAMSRRTQQFLAASDPTPDVPLTPPSVPVELPPAEAPPSTPVELPPPAPEPEPTPIPQELPPSLPPEVVPPPMAPPNTPAIASPPVAMASFEPIAAPPIAPIVLDGAMLGDQPRKRGWWRAPGA